MRLELLVQVRGQGLARLGEVNDHRRLVLLHQPVKPGVLGAVARGAGRMSRTQDPPRREQQIVEALSAA
jgi:hypothetical protein